MTYTLIGLTAILLALGLGYLVLRIAVLRLTGTHVGRGEIAKEEEKRKTA